MHKIVIAVSIFTFFVCCTRNGSKSNSIEYFVKTNDTARVSAWLREGGNPNFFIDSSSLLYLATGPEGGHDVMKLLVKAGADINKGAYTYTPLMKAANWDDFKSVVFLLENGANPNLRNEKGETALDMIGICHCEEENKTRNILTAVTKPGSR